MLYDHTHAPIFGPPLDPNTTYSAIYSEGNADWPYRPTYRPSPSSIEPLHHIGDYPWPTPHPTYPYPAIPTPLQPLTITTTANAAPTLAERPEDTLARACYEIAAAAARLQASADALGLDLDRDAIRKAIYRKIADALGD